MARAWSGPWIALTLGLVAVALAGCPRRPVLAPGAGAPGGPSVAAPAAVPPAGGPEAAGAPTPAPGAQPGAPAGPQAGVTPAAPGAAPGAPGAPGTVVPAVPAPKEYAETAALQNIHFDFDKYEIRPRDAEILRENARWLAQAATAQVLVEGHCDERGTNEYNLALGERRAKATRDFLVSLGIAASRINTISYGEERPVCIERTEACWAQNRRAHFLVKLGNL